MLKLFAVAGALALSSGAIGAASAATIADYSFENPTGVSGFDYNPTVAGVVFTGDAGVASGTGFDPAPDGVQNAFLQSTASSGAQIDISVTGLTPGDVYSFSYFDDQRNGYGVNPYTVSFNGSTIASYSPAATGWTARTTGAFTALGSTGTLTFATPVLCCDNGAGIDAITLNGSGAAGVPEPAAWALMLVGLGGLGAATRARRRLTAVGI
ncbi:MAG: hypothetical protein JWO83_769 [Caulobacteraceae bacterium]|nr:hypothetical protein [Caulobacteraceae bacterium]